jgi:hypothetical protein
VRISGAFTLHDTHGTGLELGLLEKEAYFCCVLKSRRPPRHSMNLDEMSKAAADLARSCV